MNGATWLYEHKQNHKKSSLKLLVRFWNNLIEMFLEWPFSESFLKFWSVNKHGISECRLLALYRHKEILVMSSLKATKKKLARAISKIRWAIQGHLGPLVSHEEILKKSSSLKPLIRFWNNFIEMFLFKSCSGNFDLSINLSLARGGYLHCTDIKKFLWILLWKQPPPPKKKKMTRDKKD